jgi:hypothetical protein
MRIADMQFNSDIKMGEGELIDYQPGSMTPVQLLYQSGYLTIT